MAKRFDYRWSADLKGCATSDGRPIVVAANGHLVGEVAARHRYDHALAFAAAPDALRACLALVQLEAALGGRRCSYCHGTPDHGAEPNCPVHLARQALAKAGWTP